MTEVALYIDGFNFFYGVHNTFKKRRQKRGGPNLGGLTYCDFRLLVEQFFLEQGDELSLIKYFTAPVTQDDPKANRRAGEPGRYRHWREAVESIEGLTVIEGYHKQHSKGRRKEKQSDVNLAVELILDGISPGGYDRAILLTNDPDLIPAAIAVAARLPQPKGIEVVLPPGPPLVKFWEQKLRGFKVRQDRRSEIVSAYHREAPIPKVRKITETQLANSLLPLDRLPGYWQLSEEYLQSKRRTATKRCAA